VYLWGGFKRNRKEEAGLKTKEGNTTAFLIPQTTPRGFFGILTTPWRILFQCLRGHFETISPGANRA
jgi:hypothetical protein